MIKKQKKTNKSISNILSVILTLLVIGIYLIPNFASAVVLTTSADKEIYESADDTIIFTANIDITTNEKIPIQELTLDIMNLDTGNIITTCTFDPDGTKKTSCTNINISEANTNSYIYSDSGYAFGYGYGQGWEDIETTFGYGYGFGYGQDNPNSYQDELSYTIEWDLKQAAPSDGNYGAKLRATANDNQGNVAIYQSKTADSALFTLDRAVEIDETQGVANDTITAPIQFTETIDASLNEITQVVNLVLTNSTITTKFVDPDSDAKVNIPADTNITQAKVSIGIVWDGTIIPPVVKDAVDIITGTESGISASDVNGLIKVGANVDGVSLTLSKSVTIDLPVTGVTTGYVKIYYSIDGDTWILLEDGLSISGNLASFSTSHFTYFMAVEAPAPTTPTPPTPAPAGGGGGGCFHRWTCEEWSECTEDGIQTRTCDYTGTCRFPNTNPNPTEQECEYIAPEEEVIEEITPEEVAPTGVAAVTGAVIGAAKEVAQTIWTKIIGGIVIVFVIIYLLYVIIFRTGAPLQLVKRDSNWYYNRAALMHRKADEMYRKGKKNKSEKLFKKAQSYRERGEHKQK